MAKQYGAKRVEKSPGAKSATNSSPVGYGARKPLERRASDRGHTGQLLWSFAVAICLILAALLQWTVPKNALIEQDRAPAQMHFETGAGPAPSLNGS
jgi:hypothetical protein